jgi:hypothetical protein
MKSLEWYTFIVLSSWQNMPQHAVNQLSGKPKVPPDDTVSRRRPDEA